MTDKHDYKPPKERPTTKAKEEAQQFVDRLATKHGLDPYWTLKRG